MKPLYTGHATTTGGRAGHVRTDDGTLDLGLSVPKSMGGPGAAGATNPEQLFAAGYSACFGGAVEYVARQRKLAIAPVQVTADVTLGTEESGAFRLAMTLTTRIPGQPKSVVDELVQAAHEVCPYSRATRGNIEVRVLAAE